MKPANLLFILCVEHNPRVLGCAGHPMIRTPNLDRLAAKGVRFSVPLQIIGEHAEQDVGAHARRGAMEHRTQFEIDGLQRAEGMHK